MAFNTALSGVNAAAKHLDVIGNNIANVSSNGFKRFRAEFGDLFITDPFGNSKTAAGQGAITDIVRQNFAAGSFNFTERALDFAVDGKGFFVTRPDPNELSYNYTRDGAFGVDKDGFVVNSTNEQLMAFPTTDEGAVTSTALASAVPIRIPDSIGAPTPTTLIDLTFNLPSNATAIPAATVFDSADTTTFNHSTSLNVYDSLGNTHNLALYFRKIEPTGNNTWEAYVQFDNADPSTGLGPHTIVFNADGTINTINGTAATDPAALIPVTMTAADLGNGAADLALDIDISEDTSQFNETFTVTEIDQDGATVGRFVGLDTDEDGLILAEYSNGTTQALGKLMLATFASEEALKPIGSNAWQETLGSGEPVVGEPNSGQFGSIQPGALETSNVNLTNELVALITAQRDFDANARSIDVENQVTNTILQIR